MVQLTRTRDLVVEGGPDRRLRRDVRQGTLSRVLRGNFAASADWQSMTPAEQHCLRARAFAASVRGTPVFSHWTAAALWGLRLVGELPFQLHVTVPAGSGQRTTRTAVRHHCTLEGGEIVQLDGILVTSPLRTVIDFARGASFEASVAVVDHVIRVRPGPGDAAPRIARDILEDAAFSIHPGSRGVRQLRAAVIFGDGRADSAGESMSRVTMSRIGVPKPELQVEVVDRDGRRWWCDFGWEEQRVFGEFDGAVKYTRAQFLNGRTASQVVMDEKRREDAIRRATSFGMARWEWADAVSARRLAAILAAAGIHPRRTAAPRIIER